MPLRKGWYTQATSDVAAGGAVDYTDLLTLNFPQVNGKTYWVIGTVAYECNSVEVDFRLLDVTAGDVELHVLRDGKPHSTAGAQGRVILLGRIVAGATRTNQLKLQFKLSDATTATAKSYSLTVIEAHSLDQYAEADTVVTSTANTMTTVMSLTWTAAGETYDIIGISEVDGTAQTQINDLWDQNGSTSYDAPDTSYCAVTNDSFVSVFHHRATLTGAQDWRIRQRNTDNTSSTRSRRNRILALAHTSGESHKLATQGVKTSTTNTSFQDVVTLTFTASGNPYLVLFMCLADSTAVGLQGEVKMVDNGVDIAPTHSNYTLTVANADNPVQMGKIVKPAASASVSYKIQQRSISGGSMGVYSGEILAIEFIDAALLPTGTPPGTLKSLGALAGGSHL